MKKCGLVTEKGKLVPLKDVTVEIQISGFVAHVISHLQYENNEDTPIEAEFTFPLDDGSAVYKFEAVIEDRHIVAECQEKEEARQTYEDAIEAGDTAMLLEEDDTSGDIFRCLVGNLPPKTTAKLIIGYVIELPVEHDGKLRFTLPVILNPRYSPNVGGLEGAKGATYALRKKDIPYTFKLSATIDGSKEVKVITASQPHIDVEQGPDKTKAKVVFKEDFTFDSDVRLFVEYDNMYEPECLVENGDSEKTGFLAEDVLMVNLFPKIDTVGVSNKGEYIFVLDRSGSMGFGANRIKHAKEALLLFLKSLPVGCYFNIVSFGSSFEFLFQGESKEYTEKSLQTALTELKSMDANLGGTEILQPLKAIYAQKTLAEHPRQLFLLTDGEVGNVREVISTVKKNASNTRVFTIGIGAGASTSLVNGVARAGNGKAEFIKDSERMQPKVVALLKFAMQRSITDVNIGWELPSSVTAITMPETPACLFDGDRLILYALLQGNTEPQISGKVFINGKTDKGPANFSANFFYDKSAPMSSFAPFHRLAAKAQIKLLEDKEGDSEDSKKQIIALSVASNMTSKHTSFVAIDKEKKEKVIGKQIRRNIPIMANMGAPMLLCSARSMQTPVNMRARALPMSTPVQACFGGAPPDSFRSAKKKGGIFSWNPFSSSKKTKKRAHTSQGDVSLAENEGMDAKVMSRNIARSQDFDDDIDESFDEDMDVSSSLDDIVMPPSGDPMMDMISLQSFRGNWKLTDDVCKALKTEIKALKGLKVSENDDILATLAVLVWLEVNYNSRFDEWEMIKAKAMTWLSGEKMDDSTVKEKMTVIQDSLASSMKI